MHLGPQHICCFRLHRDKGAVSCPFPHGCSPWTSCLSSSDRHGDCPGRPVTMVTHRFLTTPCLRKARPVKVTKHLRWSSERLCTITLASILPQLCLGSCTVCTTHILSPGWATFQIRTLAIRLVFNYWMCWFYFFMGHIETFLKESL